MGKINSPGFLFHVEIKSFQKLNNGPWFKGNVTRKRFWSTVWLQTLYLEKCSCDRAVVPDIMDFSETEKCEESHLRKLGWCKQLRTMVRHKRVNTHILTWLNTDRSTALLIAWWHRILLASETTHTEREEARVNFIANSLSPSSVKHTHPLFLSFIVHSLTHLLTRFFSHTNLR